MFLSLPLQNLPIQNTYSTPVAGSQQDRLLIQMNLIRELYVIVQLISSHLAFEKSFICPSGPIPQRPLARQ